MNVRLTLAVAMLFGSLTAGLIAASAPRAGAVDASMDDTLELAMLECAGGYHTGPHGNCQPDNGIVDSRCQDGFEAAPFPGGDGYRCVPEPQGY
jgi:hypothetical protein